MCFVFDFESFYFVCGPCIKKYRESCCMTQRELADLIGVSINAISAYENDEYKPSLDVIMRLSFVFGCAVESLVEIRYV